MRLARTDYGRPGKGYNGLQLRESSDQRPPREADRTARRGDKLKGVTDRRCIEFPQSLEVCWVW